MFRYLTGDPGAAGPGGVGRSVWQQVQSGRNRREGALWGHGHGRRGPLHLDGRGTKHQNQEEILKHRQANGIFYREQAQQKR